MSGSQFWPIELATTPEPAKTSTAMLNWVKSKVWGPGENPDEEQPTNTTAAASPDDVSEEEIRRRFRLHSSSLTHCGLNNRTSAAER